MKGNEFNPVENIVVDGITHHVTAWGNIFVYLQCARTYRRAVVDPAKTPINCMVCLADGES